MNVPPLSRRLQAGLSEVHCGRTNSVPEHPAPGVRFPHQPRRETNMRRTFKRTSLVATAAILATFALGVQAVAHPEPSTDGATHDHSDRDAQQHGDTAGHLPATNLNVELISKLKLKNAVPEKIADVGVHKGYAYLAAWGVVTCKYNGVHVVDIRNPSAPKEVSFIQAKEGSYPGEGVQALSISTPKFTGDILVSNNEKCGDKTGFGGMNLYNISNPGNPSMLAEGIGDTTANGQGKKAANEIHSVFAWDAGDKAYAVMVDNEEGLDVDIVDITDPKKAVVIAEYDLAQKFPQILQNTPGNLVEVFFHDVIVKEVAGRQIMSLSYWDAGYVLLDMTNPLDPTYIGDSDFPNPDTEPLESGFNVAPEGNAHQSEFTMDNRYLIGSDEDFSPYALKADNTTDSTSIHASSGSGTRQLTSGQVLTGQAVYVGRACVGDTAVPAGGPGSQIAVIERGVCTFTEKVASVLAAGGYEGVLIFNRTGSDACDGALGMSVEGDIPTFGVAPRSDGLAIFGRTIEANCLALPSDGSALSGIPVGTVGDSLRFESAFDGWGYVRLFKQPLNGGKLQQVDTYAIPEAHDPAYASGFGDLSGHEVATSLTNPSLAYFSYYAGGFRVAKIANDQLTEVGRFIDQGGSNFWGVQVFQSGGQEYVAASDRDFGLYIFKYTGP